MAVNYVQCPKCNRWYATGFGRRMTHKGCKPLSRPRRRFDWSKVSRIFRRPTAAQARADARIRRQYNDAATSNMI